MTEQEKEFNELILNTKRKEQELSSELGMGIEDFKDSFWRGVSIQIGGPGDLIKAFSWIVDQVAMQCSETMDGAGYYKILFAVEKVDTQDEESYSVKMREASERRKVMSDDLQVKLDELRKKYEQ